MLFWSAVNLEYVNPLIETRTEDMVRQDDTAAIQELILPPLPAFF